MVNDTIDTTTVNLSASTVYEGATANYTFTATLSNPSHGTTTIVTDKGTITIANGQTTGTLVIASGNTDDVYLDASSLTATITSATGGNFEKLAIGAAVATAQVFDTINTTTVTLGSVTANASTTITYTASVTSPVTVAPLVITLSNGATITIPVGSTTGTSSPQAIQANVTSFTVSIAGTSGGNYEKLDTTSTKTITESIISGTKYFDVTGNGFSSDDTPLQGASFSLYLDSTTCGVSGSLDSGDGKPLATVTSAANGTYSFANLLPGTYFVQENQLAGYVQTGPTLLNYYTINVTAGSANTGYNFDDAEVCDKTEINSISYAISGPGITGTKTVSDLRGNTYQGDTVTVTYYTAIAGETQSLVSYIAPGATFSAATASQQSIFQVASLPNTAVGWHTETVQLPNCDYQVDFVCGAPIDHFGPAGSNIFYSAQNRLFSADNEGTQVYAASSLSGYVYNDTNNDGVLGSSEAGIGGVTVTLTGTDIYGNTVLRTTTTSNTSGTVGYYSFSNLAASSLAGYSITAATPTGYMTGKATVGSVGGTAGNGSLTTNLLNTNTNAVNYNFGELLGSVSGNVFVDANSNAKLDTGDSGLAGVTVTLTGIDANGKSVNLTTASASDGTYSFTGLLSGTYTVTEKHPTGYTDETPSVGTSTGTASFIQGTSETISSITLAAGTAATNENFGELVPSTAIVANDTATIGFWQNNNGQCLINSLNGSSSSTALAKWLATTYPNLYGASAGVYSMVHTNGNYLTNAEVAASYVTNFFKVTGQKTNAQILSVALAAYCTNTTLAGGNYANTSAYHFNLSTAGIGGHTFNVGSDGAAFGVANNTVLTVNQLLAYTNSRATNGVLYAKDGTSTTANTNLANDLYSAINLKGDIV